MSANLLTVAALDSLVEVAECSVHRAVTERWAWRPQLHDYPPELREPRAAFVTLRQQSRLRGCMGTLAATDPLVVTVADRARAAAFEDPRFPGIRAHDLPGLEVSVSVLSRTEPMPVSGYEELLATVQPGVDGLLVEAGRCRATLLPSVWDELAEPAHFVGALWRKAALPPGAWPAGISVSRYEAQHAGVAER